MYNIWFKELVHIGSFLIRFLFPIWSNLKCRCPLHRSSNNTTWLLFQTCQQLLVYTCSIEPQQLMTFTHWWLLEGKLNIHKQFESTSIRKSWTSSLKIREHLVLFVSPLLSFLLSVWHSTCIDTIYFENPYLVQGKTGRSPLWENLKETKRSGVKVSGCESRGYRPAAICNLDGDIGGVSLQNHISLYD